MAQSINNEAQTITIEVRVTGKNVFVLDNGELTTIFVPTEGRATKKSIQEAVALTEGQKIIGNEPAVKMVKVVIPFEDLND